MSHICYDDWVDVDEKLNKWLNSWRMGEVSLLPHISAAWVQNWKIIVPDGLGVTHSHRIRFGLPWVRSWTTATIVYDGPEAFEEDDEDEISPPKVEQTNTENQTENQTGTTNEPHQEQPVEENQQSAQQHRSRQAVDGWTPSARTGAAKPAGELGQSAMAAPRAGRRKTAGVEKRTRDRGGGRGAVLAERTVVPTRLVFWHTDGESETP